MAISSQRFNFQDLEDKIPVKDLRTVTSNVFAGSGLESELTALAKSIGSSNVLSNMNSNLSNFMSMVNNASAAVLKTLNNALNSAIALLEKTGIPDFARKILNSLKNLAPQGLKDFLKDAMRVGSVFLCNNLEFLKGAMLGYALTENILIGLLIGLLLSWLDRYCKGFSKEEVLKSDNKSILGMIVGNDGVSVNQNNVLERLGGGLGDYFRSIEVIPSTGSLPLSEVIAGALTGNVESVLTNLRNSELDTATKRTYISGVETEMSSYPHTSPEYSRLNLLRGRLTKLPPVNPERRAQTSTYSNVKDTLGSLLLNLRNVDMSTVNTNAYSPVEKSIHDKLTTLQNNVGSDGNLSTRDHSPSSFANYKFDTIIPEFSPEEMEYILNQKGLDESRRFNGLHPTSTVFLEEKASAGPRKGITYA